MKRIAAVQDISGLGRCSLAAALPVLSVMGHQCCPVPTAVFTNQTGFSRFAVHDCGDLLRGFIEMWQLHGVALDAIYTGYLGNLLQVEGARALIEALRGPDTLLLVDPVMGDNGVAYPGFSKELCDAVAALAARADVITPNVTEACILTGTDYEGFMLQNEEAQLHALRRMCEALQSPRAVITGWRRGGSVCNIAYSGGAVHVTENPAVEGSFSGTGDLLASVLLGGLMRGDGLEGSLQRACLFLERALREADPARGEEGVPFENHLKELLC